VEPALSPTSTLLKINNPTTKTRLALRSKSQPIKPKHN